MLKFCLEIQELKLLVSPLKTGETLEDILKYVKYDSFHKTILELETASFFSPEQSEEWNNSKQCGMAPESITFNNSQC